MCIILELSIRTIYRIKINVVVGKYKIMNFDNYFFCIFVRRFILIPKKVEDKDLIARLQNPKTKHKAFEILLQKYQRRLYWHIRRMVLSHDDADDILQETFIKVFKSIDGFRADSSLFSWLYRIATNQALDFLKKKAKEQHISMEDFQYDRASNLQTDAYYEGDEMQLKFQQAIATLPEKQQLVFNMKYFEDMKYEEISEILQTSVGALKASYHHAVQKIKKFIETN